MKSPPIFQIKIEAGLAMSLARSPRSRLLFPPLSESSSHLRTSFRNCRFVWRRSSRPKASWETISCNKVFGRKRRLAGFCVARASKGNLLGSLELWMYSKRCQQRWLSFSPSFLAMRPRHSSNISRKLERSIWFMRSLSLSAPLDFFDFPDWRSKICRANFLRRSISFWLRW